MSAWPRVLITAHEYRIGEVTARLAPEVHLHGTASDAFDPVAPAQAMESLANELERVTTELRNRARAYRDARLAEKREFDAMRAKGNEVTQP